MLKITWILSIVIISIIGTPWQPEFGNWAFNLERGEQCLQKWDQIPENTDVLVRCRSFNIKLLILFNFGVYTLGLI